MDLDTARSWVSAHASIELGYYIDGDDGQPNPGTVYCRTHAVKIAKRLTRKHNVDHMYCQAWAGSDRVERCGIASCDIVLDTGSLTEEGIRWALGMDEEHPIEFVATVDELELVRRALPDIPGCLQDHDAWQLWLSQVLRRQPGVTKRQDGLRDRRRRHDRRQLARSQRLTTNHEKRRAAVFKKQKAYVRVRKLPPKSVPNECGACTSAGVIELSVSSNGYQSQSMRFCERHADVLLAQLKKRRS